MIPIDWSQPIVQGAAIGAVVGLVGVVVAAIAGVGGALLGAWIAAKGTRAAAAINQVEAQADRDAARAARFADRTLELAAQLLDIGQRYERGIAQQMDQRRKEPLPRTFMKLNLGETFGQVIQELRLIVRYERSYWSVFRLEAAVLGLEECQVPPQPVTRPTADDIERFDRACDVYRRARDEFELDFRAELGSPALSVDTV